MQSGRNIKQTKAKLSQQILLGYAFMYAIMFNMNIDNINSVVSWTLSIAYQKITKL